MSQGRQLNGNWYPSGRMLERSRHQYGGRSKVGDLDVVCQLLSQLVRRCRGCLGHPAVAKECDLLNHPMQVGNGRREYTPLRRLVKGCEAPPTQHYVCQSLNVKRVRWAAGSYGVLTSKQKWQSCGRLPTEDPLRSTTRYKAMGHSTEDNSECVAERRAQGRREALQPLTAAVRVRGKLYKCSWIDHNNRMND